MLAILLVFSIAMPDAAPNPYAAEADRLTKAMIAHFYDEEEQIWRPRIATAESVGTEGYTFWSCLVAWQAIIEAAKVDPKTWKPQIAPFYDALEQYYDRADSAYCAWKYFPGNEDKFYDDNAWAAMACMEAFEVTADRRYRDRAIAVFDNFVKEGWDGTGFRWGTADEENRRDRTACSASSTALAALRVGKWRHDPEDLMWAKRALDWIRSELVSPQGLICDGFSSPSYRMNRTTWTYNTGAPIRAALEYAEQSGDSSYRDWARDLGDAAIDRSKAMYDGAVKNPKHKYWYDATFFVQYLADGLRQLTLATGDEKYLTEARRNADYVMAHLRDDDGLYWRTMRLWMIDEKRHRAFTQLTGQTTPALTPDGGERSHEPEDLKKPTGERPMTKTLLGNAGAARLLWLMAH